MICQVWGGGGAENAMAAQKPLGIPKAVLWILVFIYTHVRVIYSGLPQVRTMCHQLHCTIGAIALSEYKDEKVTLVLAKDTTAFYKANHFLIFVCLNTVSKRRANSTIKNI